jgi:hypothetical protein
MKLPYFTTDELIKSIKRNHSIPQSQYTFTDEDFIAFLNEEMSLGSVPSVIRMKENYFLTTVLVPLVSGVSQYELPSRAIGNKAREISYVDNSGNVCEMTCIQIGDLPFYNDSSNNSEPYAYYIENNVINIVASMDNPTGSLSISYYMRPNQLVLLEEVGIIQDIDRTTGEIFLDEIPEDFSTNQIYDMIQYTSPHKCLDIDVSIVSINTVNKSITLDVDDIPTNLKIGDHISIAQQSAIPQLPSDLHPVLAHRAGLRCLESLGDTEGYQVASAKLAEFEKNTENLIDDRVEDSPKKIVNRRSILSGGLSSRRYRYRG